MHLLRSKRPADHRAHPAAILRRSGHSRQHDPCLPVVQFRQRRQAVVRVERAPVKRQDPTDCGRQVPVSALRSPRQPRDAERGQKRTGLHDVPGLRLNAAMCRGGHGGEADGVLSGGGMGEGFKILHQRVGGVSMYRKKMWKI